MLEYFANIQPYEWIGIGTTIWLLIVSLILGGWATIHHTSYAMEAFFQFLAAITATVGLGIESMYELDELNFTSLTWIIVSLGMLVVTCLGEYIVHHRKGE
jgi:hypothetical protein